jgi:hypothetical protein
VHFDVGLLDAALGQSLCPVAFVRSRGRAALAHAHVLNAFPKSGAMFSSNCCACQCALPVLTRSRAHTWHILKQVECVFGALRLLVVAGAIAYMTHAGIVRMFASPTEGLLMAVSMDMLAEKESYIAQVSASTSMSTALNLNGQPNPSV